MTEAEWLASTNFRSLLYSLPEKGSERKPFLFACACCRLVWHLLPDRCHRLVEAVERYADGETKPSELVALFDGFTSGQVALLELPGGSQAAQAVGSFGWQWPRGFNPGGGQAWYTAGQVARSAAEALAKTVLWESARGVQIELLRCVFGNPFRPATLDSNWRTSTAVAIARGMYDSRDFAATPILADALQDAGCENEDVLTHCRGPGPHVRGCWVVDLVLGKE